MTTNRRETGVRKPQIDDCPAETDQNAGMPKKPEPYGLTGSIDKLVEDTKRSRGSNPSKAPNRSLTNKDPVKR